MLRAVKKFKYKAANERDALQTGNTIRIEPLHLSGREAKQGAWKLAEDTYVSMHYVMKRKRMEV